MIAAIYARKSTEQNGVAEDDRSVARQVDHAKAYAAKKGWTVIEEHIYKDDGISGAEFARRPDFLRLMNALKPKPSFQVLVMSEESRLGREAIETAYALKQIVTAGVRVFFYLEDRERVLESPTDKVMLSLTTFADELEREKARQRTHDALVRKARAGQVPGGSVYGYSNEEVATTDPVTGRRQRLHVTRRVNEAEADVVRRIFELASAGKSARSIAIQLNDEGVPSPLPRRAGRDRSWAGSTIYAMLTRPLYRGEVVWNRSRKRNAWGIKKQSARPKEEWIHQEVPELRIVPESLWQAVQERLKTSGASYLRASNGQLWGRPANGIESKYLLTGLAQCGACGGSLIAHSRSSGRHRKYVYQCSYHYLRGKTVCRDGILLPMDDANQAVLETFEQEVLHPKVIEVGLRHGLELLKPTEESVVPRREALQADLAVLDQELARFTSAVAQGGDIPALVEAIKVREERKRRLQEELAGIEGLQRVASIDLNQLQSELQARLAGWQDLLNRQVPVARQIVKKLLSGRIAFRRREDGTYEFSGQASLGRIIAGLPCTKALVAPTGFEPVFTSATRFLQ